MYYCVANVVGKLHNNHSSAQHLPHPQTLFCSALQYTWPDPTQGIIKVAERRRFVLRSDDKRARINMIGSIYAVSMVNAYHSYSLITIIKTLLVGYQSPNCAAYQWRDTTSSSLTLFKTAEAPMMCQSAAHWAYLAYSLILHVYYGTLITMWMIFIFSVSMRVILRLQLRPILVRNVLITNSSFAQCPLWKTLLKSIKQEVKINTLTVKLHICYEITIPNCINFKYHFANYWSHFIVKYRQRLLTAKWCAS